MTKQVIFFYCLSAPKIRVQQNRTKGLITNHLYVRENNRKKTSSVSLCGIIQSRKNGFILFAAFKQNYLLSF